MSKATYVCVGGQARKVKNVLVKVGGVLKQKVVPKGNIGGAIKEFISYYMPFVYSGGFDDYIRKINPEGAEIWSLYNRDTYALTVDPDGNVYSGSYYDYTVRKIDADGNEVWVFTGHSNSIFSVAVDINGNVYSSSKDTTVKKIDSNGDEVWSFNQHAGDVYGLAVDRNGNVYSGGGSSDYTVYKIDADGNEVWRFNQRSAPVSGVAVDYNLNVYIAYSSFKIIDKVDVNGNLVETYQASGIGGMYAVAVDANGYVYGGCDDTYVYKFDTNANVVWNFTGHSDTVRAVTVDPNGNVYSGSFDDTVRKIDADGNEVWVFTGHSANVYCVAVAPGLYGAFPEKW